MQNSRSPDAWVAAFRANPDLPLSAEDLRSLEFAAFTSIWAAKAVLLQYFKAADFKCALPLALSIANREPTSDNVRNAVVCLRNLKRYAEALLLVKSNKGHLEPFRYEDLLCSLHGLLGQAEDAVLHGDEALRLKDVGVANLPAKLPRLHRFVPERRSRNMICFSI